MQLVCDCGALLVRRGARGPLPSVCDTCKKAHAAEANKRWRETNIERVRLRQRERSRKWKERNRERVRAEAREYMAARLEKDPELREQMRERIRRLWREQPEHMAEIQRRSYRKHAERRRAERRERAAAKRVEIYERDGGRCHLCGRIVSRDDFHIDHLIPTSKGGSTIPENLAVAHPFCNQTRGAGRLPAQLRLVG